MTKKQRLLGAGRWALASRGLLDAGRWALARLFLSASGQSPAPSAQQPPTSGRSRSPGTQQPLRSLLIVLLSASSLSACTSSLLDTELPPNVIYVIAPAPAPSSPTTNMIPVDISIGRPDVAPGLDTNRIAVLKGRLLDYYRAARWGGSTTEVVQTFLVDSLEDQRLFRSVTAEQARVAGDYVLDVELRDFQAEYASDNDAPTVRVKMVGRLIRIGDRELVATVSAEVQSPASADRMHAVAAAFETGAQKAAVELAQKTAAAIAGDGRQK